MHAFLVQLATYVYEKVAAPFENAFRIDENGKATGLNLIPNLPEGGNLFCFFTVSFYCLLLAPLLLLLSLVYCLLSLVSCLLLLALLLYLFCCLFVLLLALPAAATVFSCCCCWLVLLLLLSHLAAAAVSCCCCCLLLLLLLSLCVSFDLLFIEVGLLRVLWFILLYFLSPFCCRFCSVCLSPFHVFVCSLPSSLVSLYFICLAFRSLLSPCFLCFICFFSSFLFFLFMFIIYYLGLALFVVISAAGVCACTHPQP